MDDQEVLETPETEEEALEEDSEGEAEGADESSAEDIEKIKQEKLELEKKNKQLYERLKKKEEKEGGLSTRDTIYLAKAEIHDDDVEDVLNYANKMGVSVKDAHEFYKPILKERDEERKTSLATNVKGGQRGSSKDTPEAILSRASRGQLPTTDEGIEKLAEARMKAKLGQK